MLYIIWIYKTIDFFKYLYTIYKAINYSAFLEYFLCYIDILF